MERAVRMTMLGNSRTNDHVLVEESKDEYVEINNDLMRLTTSPHRNSYMPTKNRCNEWDDNK